MVLFGATPIEIGFVIDIFQIHFLGFGHPAGEILHIQFCEILAPALALRLSIHKIRLFFEQQSPLA